MEWIINKEQLFNYLAVIMLERKSDGYPSDQRIKAEEDEIRKLFSRLGLVNKTLKGGSARRRKNA